MIALLLLVQDSQEDMAKCAEQMSQMIKGMYNYAFVHADPEGSFPTETGPAFWHKLVEVENFQEADIRCPITGRRYSGPRSNANLMSASSALALCEHGEKVHWLAKSGDLHVLPRGSELHLKAREMIQGGLGWELARWTYAADGAAPLVIEAKEILSLGDAPGVILETSGGDLKEPVRETLFADATGIRRFGGTLDADGEKRLEALLHDLKSEEYDTREQASADLAKLYPRARDRIEKALADDDLEAQGRLRAIRKASVAHAPLVAAYPPKGDSIEVKTPMGPFRGWRISDEVVWSDDLHVPLTITRGGTTWTLKEYSAPRRANKGLVKQHVCRGCGYTSPTSGKCPSCETELVTTGDD